MKSPLQIFENWFDAMTLTERGECAFAFACYVLTPVTGVSGSDHQQHIDELKAVLERARVNKREEFIIQILKLFFDQYLGSWLYKAPQLGTEEDFMMVKRAQRQAGFDGPEQTEAELQQEYELNWMKAELQDARMEKKLAMRSRTGWIYCAPNVIRLTPTCLAPARCLNAAHAPAWPPFRTSKVNLLTLPPLNNGCLNAPIQKPL